MTAFARFLLAIFMAALTAAPALADNESYDATSSVCERVVYNCTIAHHVGSTPQSSGFAYHTNGLATGYNGGYVLASATFAPATVTLASGEYTSASTAGLTYTFQIAGPADVIVPLHVFARLSVAPIQATDYQGHLVVVDDNGVLAVPSNFRILGNAGFRLYTDRTGGIDASASNRIDPALSSGNIISAEGGPIDRYLGLPSNTDIRVELFAGAQIRYDVAGDLDPQYGQVSAEVDPFFTIEDPTFGDYHVVGVPTGDAPSTIGGVPEPASWAMIITGFGVLGAAMRRRRRIDVRIAFPAADLPTLLNLRLNADCGCGHAISSSNGD